jgi:hypothetical protein
MYAPEQKSLVPGAGDEVAQPHVALSAGDVCFVQHAALAAPVAHDVQEPRREGAQGRLEGFLDGGKGV